MATKIRRRDILRGGLGLGVAGLGAATGLTTPWVARAADKQKVYVLSTDGADAQYHNVMFKELGLFEKYGVEVEQQFVADGSKILAAIIGGSGDMCSGSGFGGLFPAIQKGAKIKVICGANIAPLNVIFASNKHPEVKSVQDLPGHTVGTGQVGALLHILSVAVMKKYNVDYTKVNFVNIGGSSDIWKALVSGSLEVGVAPVQYRDSAEKYGLHPVKGGDFYEELPLFTNQAMFASEKAIAEKREGLTGVLAAYAEIYRFMEKPENKDAFKRYYKQAVGSSPANEEEAEFFWNFLGKPGRLSRDLVLSKEQIDYVQQLNIDVGIQQTMVPLDQAVDMSIAEAAIRLIKTKS